MEACVGGGSVISGFYALIVLGVLYPAVILLSGASDHVGSRDFLQKAREGFADGFVWTVVILLLTSQVLLLFLSVDTSQKRLKPQTHIWLTCAVAGALTALLVSGLVFSVGVGISGDKFLDRVDVVNRLISRLLKGSVLELLVAVVCHVMVRRRDQCCAPMVTSFGIVMGMAIMLLSFGPGVLFLYKKRLDICGESGAVVEGRKLNGPG